VKFLGFKPLRSLYLNILQFLIFLERQMSTKRLLHILMRMNVDPGGFRCLRRNHCVRVVTRFSLFSNNSDLADLLSSTLARLCDPLRMATDVVSFLPETLSEHELGVALQVTTYGQEPFALP
jgi:hypothetical protein